MDVWLLGSVCSLPPWKCLLLWWLLVPFIWQHNEQFGTIWNHLNRAASQNAEYRAMGVQEGLFSVKENVLWRGFLGKTQLKGCINCTVPRFPFLLYLCDEERFHSKCLGSTGNFTPIIRSSFVCVVTY